MANLSFVAAVKNLAAVWANDEVLHRAARIGPLAQFFDCTLPFHPSHEPNHAEVSGLGIQQKLVPLQELS